MAKAKLLAAPPRSAAAAAAAAAPALDPASPMPLYHQLFLRFADAIARGALRAGDYLPGDRDIAEHYGVARITAVRAVRELASAGLVSREQGRGTRVNFTAEAVVRRGPRAIDAAPPREASAGAYDPSVVAFGDEDAGAALAAILGAARVQRSVRILRFAKRPYCHLTAWVPATLGRHWTAAALATTPLGALIEATGTVIGRSEERVSARLADAALAALLDVAPGSPLLEVHRTSFDGVGAAVEHAVCRYVPERYEYAVTASGRRGAGLFG